MVTPKTLIEGTLLTAGAVALYTAPKGTSTVIKKVTVTNIDNTNAHLLTLYLGAAATTNTLVADAMPIGPLATLDLTQAANHVLAPGDIIWAFGDDAVNLQIRASGVEVV